MAFNTFDKSEIGSHRRHIRVILQTAELHGYPTTIYGGWRAVIANFVAQRVGAGPTDLPRQTVAWVPPPAITMPWSGSSPVLLPVTRELIPDRNTKSRIGWNLGGEVPDSVKP